MGKLESNNNDIFAYRFYKNNMEYQIGVDHCQGAGWEKLFDNNEVKVNTLFFIQHQHYIEVKIVASLKKHTAITYSMVRYIKTENQ